MDELYDTLRKIDKIKSDIFRIERANKIMESVNDALDDNDNGRLRKLGFSDEHITDLKDKVAQGQPGFARALFKNNNLVIKQLASELSILTTHKAEKLAKRHGLPTIHNG